MRFSTARTTPSFVRTPTTVDPSLIASIAYSTWKRRPSGLNVFTPRSYSLLRGAAARAGVPARERGTRARRGMRALAAHAPASAHTVS